MTDAKTKATKYAVKISSTGAIAQLGERLPCTQEVSGSIPLSSTNLFWMEKLIMKKTDQSVLAK
jgi:hypothetical protein